MAAPYENGNFYQEYDDSRPVSEKIAAEKNYVLDLKDTRGQFFYRTIHAKLTIGRLPPDHVQLEDIDVYNLMVLCHSKRLLPRSYLQEHWSGVFDSQGFPRPARRPMGRPAIVWLSKARKWRYVCLAGVYTLCGSGHLRTLLSRSDLETTKAKGRERYFPWQRPTILEPLEASYKKTRVAGEDVFGVEDELDVDFELIDWPETVDQDRMSDRLREWMATGKGVPDGLRELAALRTDDVRKIWKERLKAEEGYESEYDPAVTGNPMLGYATATGVIPEVRTKPSGTTRSTHRSGRMSSPAADKTTKLKFTDKPIVPTQVSPLAIPTSTEPLNKKRKLSSEPSLISTGAKRGRFPATVTMAASLESASGTPPMRYKSSTSSQTGSPTSSEGLFVTDRTSPTNEQQLLVRQLERTPSNCHHTKTGTATRSALDTIATSLTGTWIAYSQGENLHKKMNDLISKMKYHENSVKAHQEQLDNARRDLQQVEHDLKDTMSRARIMAELIPSEMDQIANATGDEMSLSSQTIHENTVSNVGAMHLRENRSPSF